jgi:parvulin-like peptidyl-prolyl isomerase
MARLSLAAFLGIFAMGTVLAGDLVIVNGRAITEDDFVHAYKKTTLAERIASATAEQQKAYLNHVLNVLIEDSLVSEFLDRQKVTVDEKKVDEHIDQLRKQLETRGQTLEAFLAQKKIDEKQMRSDIRTFHRWLAYVDSQATEKALKNYFEANRAAYDGSTVRASHILRKVEPSATKEVKEAARKEIEQIRAKIAGGQSFAEAAKQHSDCPSKAEGGNLDFFPRRGRMVEPFAATAFTLELNQVSEPVETQFGWHLILVTEKKAGKPTKFEDASEEVKSDYADDLRKTLLTKLRGQAEIKTLVKDLSMETFGNRLR